MHYVKIKQMLKLKKKCYWLLLYPEIAVLEKQWIQGCERAVGSWRLLIKMKTPGLDHGSNRQRTYILAVWPCTSYFTSYCPFSCLLKGANHSYHIAMLGQLNASNAWECLIDDWVGQRLRQKWDLDFQHTQSSSFSSWRARILAEV